jgi:hypothetical protein
MGYRAIYYEGFVAEIPSNRMICAKSGMKLAEEKARTSAAI